MKYILTQQYKIRYHYLHFIPNECVIMIVPGCLVDRTLEALKIIPTIVIDDIRDY